MRAALLLSAVLILTGCDQLGESVQIRKKDEADVLFAAVKSLPVSKPCENLTGYLKLEKLEYHNKTSHYSDITTHKITRYRESCDKSRGFLDSVEATNYRNDGFKSFNDVVKHRGFKNAEETREAIKLGFYNKTEYSQAAEMTPKKYTQICGVNFDACKGRKVIWYVREDSDAVSTGRRLKVVDSCTDQRHHFIVDSNLDTPFTENRCSRIVAELVKDNWIHDDIKVNLIASSEDAEETKARLIKMEQETYLKLAQEKAKLAAELERHKTDAQWMATNYRAAIGTICAPEIEKLARYDFEWIGGLTATKFPSYVGKVKKPYVLTISGDAIKFQNGFGAFRQTTYYCDYNLKTDEFHVYIR